MPSYPAELLRGAPGTTFGKTLRAELRWAFGWLDFILALIPAALRTHGAHLLVCAGLAWLENRRLRRAAEWLRAFNNAEEKGHPLRIFDDSNSETEDDELV